MPSNSVAVALLPEKYLKIGLQLDRAGQQTLFLLQLGCAQTCECLLAIVGQVSRVTSFKFRWKLDPAVCDQASLDAILTVLPGFRCNVG